MMLENKRIHPEDRSRIEAINNAKQAIHGPPPERPSTSYYTPLLIQCTLPHSDPETRDWIKNNGNYTLIISSGVDKDGNPIGIPYGSFPRLTLAYIITEVTKTRERRIELTSNFGTFLKEIGYTGNLRGNIRPAKSIQNQLVRLLTSNISFEKTTGDSEQGVILRGKADVASKFALWWDYKQPSQENFFGSFIDISEDFYNAILSNPVPLRTDILAALKKSPLALDVYMWASYRLFTMQAHGQDQITLSYGRLQEQFGTGIGTSNYRLFRLRFKEALGEVSKHWMSPSGESQKLNYDLQETGLTLFRSPLLINIPKSTQTQQEAEAEVAHILASQKFDDPTLKKARLLAGSEWDIKWLQKQYFAWIKKEGITPKDPQAHFHSFIKKHREHNEK